MSEIDYLFIDGAYLRELYAERMQAYFGTVASGAYPAPGVAFLTATLENVGPWAQ